MSTPAEKFIQANEHLAAGREAEAEAPVSRGACGRPAHAHAWHQLGSIAVQHNRPDVAAECFIRANRLDGGQPANHNNLGNCYRSMQKLPEAAASFKQALRLDKNFLAARLNLTFTLYSQGCLAEAEASADEALRQPRTSPEEHCVAASLRLMRGDFAGGWAEHDSRLELPGRPWKGMPGKKWDGQPLEGRSILLFGEGGYGDVLHFVRYVAPVIARGGQPTVCVPRQLFPLLTASGIANLVPLEEPAPACEFNSALMSLAGVFSQSLETIYNQVPYLQADPELVTHARDRLSGIEGFRVGICWQGNPTYARDPIRSFPLSMFRALADVPGVRLISVQKYEGVEQLPTIAGQFEVIELGPEYDVESGAFMNAAAVMKNLDLMIAPDTALLHLAGALAVPVWAAISAEPAWRWMLERTDSPWYPTMRLFRQSRAGDWGVLFGRMAEALRAEAAGHQRHGIEH